jgi:hypothetical protein
VTIGKYHEKSAKETVDRNTKVQVGDVEGLIWVGLGLHQMLGQTWQTSGEAASGPT